MRDFMLLVRLGGDHIESLSAEEKQQHLTEVMEYIKSLQDRGNLRDAQPLQKGGRLVSGKKNLLKDGPFVESKEAIGGFFYIQAENIDEAVEIAKQNPMFKLEHGGEIEIREIETL